MTYKEILKTFPDTEAIKVDDFDSCVIGYDYANDKLIYSMQSMIDLCLERDMEHQDALDYLNHNVWSAWVGHKTPIFNYDIKY